MIISLSVVGIIVIFIPILLKVLDLAPYMYVNAKIRAMEAGLLKKEKLKELASAKDVFECISSLEDTDYGKHLTKIAEPITPQKIEVALNEHLKETYAKVMRIVPQEVSSALHDMLKLWDARNIRMAMRAMQAGVPPEEREQYILELGTLKPSTLKVLVESKDLEETVSELENTEYGKIISAALADSKKEGSLLPIEAALDKYVLETLYKKVACSSDENSKVIQVMVGTNIDLINLKTIIRGKAEKMDPKLLEDYLLPIHYHVKEDALKNVLRAEGLDESATYLEGTPYSAVLLNALLEYKKSGSITDIERGLDNFYRKFAKDVSVRFPLGIGPSLNLLIGKESDVKTIRTVLKYKSEPSLNMDLEGLLEEKA